MTLRSFAAIMTAGSLAVALGCATTGKKHGESPSHGDESGEEQGTSEEESEEGTVEKSEQTQPLADDSGGPPEKRTREVIGKIVQDNRQMVRDCYNEARRKDPALKGRVYVHFVLDPDGDVMSAEIDKERSDIQTPSVVECAIMLIKALKFPPSSRGMETVADYYFDLQPG